MSSTIEFTKSQSILVQAMRKGTEQDTLVNVAVVDAGGDLVALGR